jgi:hypothetical protein
MTKATVPGECKFAYPIFASENLVRGFFEHGDGKFSVCTINRRVAEAFKAKPLDAEFTFDMEEVLRTATMAFIGHPEVRDDRNAGKKLAAGVLMFAAALKILDMQETE